LTFTARQREEGACGLIMMMLAVIATVRDETIPSRTDWVRGRRRGRFMGF
jgi:hypothetical protein